MPSLYIETSIVSYLRQKPSPQVVAAARQLLTRQWWNEERGNYELVTSQYVLDEASAGDPALATERLQALNGIALLPLDPPIGIIASEIVSRAILPAHAGVDELHIAMVAYHRVPISSNLELHAYRECQDPASNPRCADGSGIPNTNHLHARRNGDR
jgi:hypothetical protein